MQDVVLAHPDTLGDINSKLEVIDRYFGFSELQSGALEKCEANRICLTLEQTVNESLAEVENQTRILKIKIKQLEVDGLGEDEIEVIKFVFLNLCRQIGVSIQK